MTYDATSTIKDLCLLYSDRRITLNDLAEQIGLTLSNKANAHITPTIMGRVRQTISSSRSAGILTESEAMYITNLACHHLSKHLAPLRS